MKLSDDASSIKEVFKRDGFVICRAFLEASLVSLLKEEADRVIETHTLISEKSFRVDFRETINNDLIVERLDPVTDISNIFRQLQQNKKIVEMVSFLLECSVLPFKDKLIIKNPSTNGYPLHQDYFYISNFGFSGTQQLAVAIPLDECSEDTGPVELFPGFHETLLPVHSDKPGEIPTYLVDESQAVTAALTPGDVLFFSSLAPHRSGPNLSERSRKILYFTYNTVQSGDHYAKYYAAGKP